MEMTMDKTAPPKWRKHVIGLLLGMASGLLGAMAMMWLIDSGTLGELGRSQVAAAMVGLIYCLTAAAVAFGLVSPSMGSRFLNVEDAEELLEQRRMLAFSAVSMIAMGVILFLLAVSGPGGIVEPLVAVSATVSLLCLVTVLSLAQWHLMDELLREVSSAGGNVSYYLVALIGGGWAVLAHLGYVVPPAPLDWITMFAGLALVGTFVAAGRRGMLTAR
jgi:hypothetical protein